MFVINGTDYTLIAVGIIVAALFFAVQYFLCGKARRIGVKLIPVYFSLLILVLAALVMTGDRGDPFIEDMRGVVALAILGFAVVCGISTGAAWMVYKARNKK